ncbi:LamG domain-containing protein [Labilibacter marinus]|uniref:LamG domain-containing protein n=1 Tax=Labilibacter marinus TaxID=1477105 RepID=UPI001300D425|nr:LamG domain-containing protein [Labilibacter marinus]
MLLFFVQNANAKSFNKSSFAIAEFSSSKDIISTFRLSEKMEYLGMSITVTNDSVDNTLIIDTEDELLTFADFLQELKQYLNNHPERVFPLFIKFWGNESELIEQLKSSHLLNQTFFQPPGERWPSIEEIQAQHKPLIIFDACQSNKTSKYFNCIQKHIVEIKLPKLLRSNNSRTIYKGNLHNELLQVKRFTKEKIKRNPPPKDWFRISLNTFSVDYLLECWNTIGKQPNFIFYSSPDYNLTFHYLTQTLSEFTPINGEILLDGKIANEVSWSHNKNALTNGYFSFPNDEGASLKLAPFKAGYQFTPEQVDIQKALSSNQNIQLIGSPLNISEGLTASYSFNHSLKNQVAPFQTHPDSGMFVTDNERGHVLKLSNGNYATLDMVDAYKIVNSSFTISVYIKLLEQQNKIGHCIVGSNTEGYRKGLHAIVRSGKPLFGFYTNDCNADTKIENMKWYQFTVRYNIVTEVQSIFIDGVKVGESDNHPSFIGASELLLGHGIKQDNFMNGYLDELKIWNRALSDEEINWLNQNVVEIPDPSWINIDSAKIIIVVLAMLLLVLFVIYRMKLARQKPIASAKPTYVSPEKNAIYLFGKFMVIDENGEDHSAQFPPKIKELFLLLLFSSLKNPRGISTSDLTDVLWNGFEPTKAANNRGVTFNGLKKVLAHIKGIDVIFEDKFWRLIINEDIFCDYKIINDYITNNNTELRQLYTLIKRGEFLSGTKKDWLLDVKSNLNFDLTDQLLDYTKENYKAKNFDIVLEVVSYIFRLDDLNTQALHYQLSCLTKQGSGNKATFLFDKFCEKYNTVHSKNYEYDLKEFLHINVDELWAK